MYKSLSYLILLSFAFFILAGCNESIIEDPPVDEKRGFETEAVAKVFTDNCATSGCHVGNNPAGSVSFSTYSDMLTGSTNRSNGLIPNYGGEVVIPYRLEESLLNQIIMGNVQPIVPHDAISLTQEEIETIQNWISSGAKNSNNEIPLKNPSYRVYVCNQNSDKISVIDGDLNIVSSIIDVNPIPTLANAPHMVKVRDGFIYQTLIGTGRLLKICTTDYETVGEATGIQKAGMIEISPDGKKAFVSRSSTSDPIYQSIYAVDLNSMSIITEIVMAAPGVPHGMALTPDGNKLYVANLTLDRISIINGITNEYGDYDDIVLPNGTEPMQAKISPDGNYLYISARGTAKLLIIDTSTDSIVNEVDVDMMPMQIAITSDGNKIYVGSMMMHTVNVIQKTGNTWSMIKQIAHPGFNMLHGCDITGDNKYVYVSSRNTNGNFKPYFEVAGEGFPGTVGIIDTQTDEVIKLIEIEQFGSGLFVE
jgi:YVTN family beta-propeller protein